MKKYLLTLSLLSLVFVGLDAQKRRSKGLEGLWKGTITINGLEDPETLKFELYIQKKGAKLEGRSYIYQKNNKVVEMEVKGSIYGDFSIYLKDTEYIPFPGDTYKPAFNRKYQLQYKPSIWETKMEGFWQELTDHYFSEKRNLGRIKLRKIKERNKA